MKKFFIKNKKILSFLLSIVLIISSNSICFTAIASDDEVVIKEEYVVTVNDTALQCAIDDQLQKDMYLFIASIDDNYFVVDKYYDISNLYYFDENGNGSLFSGVYGGNYYNSGKLGVAEKSYYKVYNKKVYTVSNDAAANVYIKDASKKTTYVMLVDGTCYNVVYNTGSVSAFTGVYSGKYYKSGKLGTAESSYYKVYSKKLYLVSKKANASVYKKDTKKSGTYVKAVDGIYYSVSYKTGAASTFTGKYKSKFYKSGKLTDGWQTVSKKTYYCKSGVPVKGIKKINKKIYYFDKNGVKYTGTGWKTVNKKKYYFSKGVAKTGWAMIKRCCYNFNSSGVLSKNKTVDGIKVDKKGKATGPVKKYVPLHAKLLAKQITKSSQSKEKKLKTCFNYVIKTYKSNGNPRIPHYTKKDWIYVYANDMYGDRCGGNCFSYAAAFAFLAKECGYDNVYACNSGGHAWVEIDNKVYDPEQYKDVGKKIYGWEYSNPKIKNYKPAISDYKKNPWKRVKIPG